MKDPWAWDDFTSPTLTEDYEQFIQKLVLFIECCHYARHKNEWCNEEGNNALLRLADAIEQKTLPFPPTKEEEEEFDKNMTPSRYRNIILDKNMTPLRYRSIIFGPQHPSNG